MSFQARFRSNPSSILRAVGSVEFHSSRGTKPSPSPLRSSPEIFPIRRRLQVRFLSFFEKTERRLKKSTPEMGSPRRDLRSGAHLRRITAAGQRRSTPVKPGQRRSTPVNTGRRIFEDRLSGLFSTFWTCLQPRICEMESRRLRMAIKKFNCSKSKSVLNVQQEAFYSPNVVKRSR